MHAPATTLSNPHPAACLASGPCVDGHHPTVVAYTRRVLAGLEMAPARERAVALAHAVRDDFRYDPYRVDLSPQGISASRVLALGYGWCVPKAVLLAACARVAGIPARLGYADVRNHLSTPKLLEQLGTDLFIWHGYTDVWLDGAWRKATPAFNRGLCERLNLHPLDFDGVHDSIYHPFDRAGQQHMEYVALRGAFVEPPLGQMQTDFAALYKGWGQPQVASTGGDFTEDLLQEQQQAQQPGPAPA